MKKTILAVTLGLIAGSASAANVYNNAEQGVNVDVHGAVEMQYFQGFEFYTQNEDAKVRIDDGEFNVLTTVELNETTKALAYFDFEVEKSEHVKNDELWLGLETAHGTFKAGRLNTVWDDSGIGRDYELAVSDLGSFEGLNANTDVIINALGTFDEGDNAVRYDLEMGNFYAAVAHKLKETKADDSEVSGTDAKVGFKFGDFDVRAFYQINDSGHDRKLNAYTFEAEYNHNAFGIAASLKDVEYKNDNTNLVIGYQDIAASAEYKFDDLTLAGGVNLIKTTDAIDGADGTNVYVNLTKQVHKNVIVYGEVGYTNVSLDNNVIEDDSSVAYVAGMEVKF